MCKITLISYYRYKIYIAAGEKVTKITRRYSGSSLDNPVPDTFPRLEYGTKQQNPDKSNSTCLHGPAMKGSCTTTAIKRSRVRIPAGTAGEFSSPGSTFCADSYFGIRSTPVLLQ